MGGSAGQGVVFKLNTDGSAYAVLQNFGSNMQGSLGTLTVSGSTLYGTTQVGGSSATAPGTVFSINTDGSGFAILKEFSGADGDGPIGGLFLSGGTLFGTTSRGGYGYGTVFSLGIDGGNFTTLTQFMGDDGANPGAGLAVVGSTFYGATYGGGVSGNGTLFKIGPDGSNFSSFYAFTNSETGVSPNGDLAISGSTLYGTTSAGGSAGNGLIFKANLDGTGYTVLWTFTNQLDGVGPVPGLVLLGTTLYGATEGGGHSGNGTIFKVNTDGSDFAVIKFFEGGDGAYPLTGPILWNGALYGTTYQGGTNGQGTVFRLNPLPGEYGRRQFPCPQRFYRVRRRRF
jgi:uncharacterized repeat protein (TIGR03803 family)